jgi:serine/threonine protein phosphatase PrpC
MAVEFVRQNAGRLKNASACGTLLHDMDHAIAMDRDAGETTCTLAVVDEDLVFGASVGDSAAWIIDEASDRYTDLSSGQIRKPFVGLGGARPFVFSYRKKKGQRLLLATDGLLKYSSPETIAAVSCEASVESSASRLIELVRYPSGDLPDDITVILASS